MTRYLSLKSPLVLIILPLLFYLSSPCRLNAEEWIFAFHGGTIDKKKGFQEKAFDQGFFLGGKVLKPLRTPDGLFFGFETNYRLMDGEETVKDPYGVYDSSNSYKLADASVLLRYAILHYGGSTLFIQMNGGGFWEKTTHTISPLSRTLESGSSENTGLFYAAGGGAILFNHFELYGVFNRLEDNELITLSIGWIFN